MRANATTIIRLSNGGPSGVDVRCEYLDRNGNKNGINVSTMTLPPRSPVSFDMSQDPYFLTGGNRGALFCWAVSSDDQVKWNYLGGTATVFNTVNMNSYEYNAWSFAVRAAGTDGAKIGTPGQIKLNGQQYDACPQYLVGQFSPAGTQAFTPGHTVRFYDNAVAVAACSVDLTAPHLPVGGGPYVTTLRLRTWNDAGGQAGPTTNECIDEWDVTTLPDRTLAASKNSEYYRIQGVSSTSCSGSKAVGLVGVQSSNIDLLGPLTCQPPCVIDPWVGTTLNGENSAKGCIIWQSGVDWCYP